MECWWGMGVRGQAVETTGPNQEPVNETGGGRVRARVSE